MRMKTTPKMTNSQFRKIKIRLHWCHQMTVKAIMNRISPVPKITTVTAVKPDLSRTFSS